MSIVDKINAINNKCFPQQCLLFVIKVYITMMNFLMIFILLSFRTRKSRGFAFVNFTSASAVKKFYNAFHLAKWDFISWSKWPKTIQIVAAKIQVTNSTITCVSCLI